MPKHDADPALDRLLRAYRIPLATGEDAVAQMVRAARVRAVEMRDRYDQHGFFALVACAFGFRRAAPLVWSSAAGIVVALVLGVSVGASDVIPVVDEQAFTVDFDAVLGAGATTAGQDLPL